MEKKEVTTCRVENHLSPANKIPDDHTIVQHDVNNAIMTCQDERHQRHMGIPTNYDRLFEAQDTLHRARHHQPGEAGSSTWSPGSRRPGTIVRRP